MRSCIPALLFAALLPAGSARAGLPLQITIDCPSHVVAELPPLDPGTWSPPSGWGQAVLYDAPLAPVPVVEDFAASGQLFCGYGVPFGSSGISQLMIHRSEPAAYSCVASPSTQHKGFVCTLDGWR